MLPKKIGLLSPKVMISEQVTKFFQRQVEMKQELNNRYRVIKALSSGGFGETFLAEDNQMPSGRKCVIKQLKPVVGNSKNYQIIQERFQREAAILETLGESNTQIPQLYAYFSESNNFFLVQEWIRGKTIADLVEQSGTLKQGAVKKILISILQILEQVHSKGIIHRDIKPENIIIREQDGLPVLIDFGAVKETMGVQAAGNSRTQSIVIGTFGFMPPEQTAGRPVFSSDLYSLGLTAIYMLTGKNPSELEINLQTGEIDWQQYALGVSPAIMTVIERSIQPSAENRYATATEMLAACNTASNKPKGNRIRSTSADMTTVLVKSTRGKTDHRPLKLVSWLKTAATSSLVVGVPIGLLFNLNLLKSFRPNEVSSTSSASSSSSNFSSDLVPKADSNALSKTTSVNYSTSNRKNTEASLNTSDANKQRNLEKLLKTKECRNCDLTGVNLSGANLSNAKLYDANLKGAVLSRANLYHAKLRNSSLADAKLDNANLYQANLSNADLEKADLTKANLAQADLENTNLGKANLSNAFLAGGRLISTNLVEANLSNANLKDATLKQANLSKARLNGANLTGATLCSHNKSNCANLDGASLNQVIGLEQN